MFNRPILSVVGFAAAGLFAAVTLCWAQNAAPQFDGRAIETATLISGRTCSNPILGITYDLPAGMKTEDARAMRMAQRRGEIARTGIGPEADYILWGSGERSSLVSVCGSASDRGQVMVLATPTSIIQAAGQDSLVKLLQGLTQAMGGRAGEIEKQEIASTNFEHAEAHWLAPPARGKPHEFFESTYATEANSYALVWAFVAYRQKDLNDLVASMNSLKIGQPQPPPAPTPAPAAHATLASMPREIVQRVGAFAHAWLIERDRTKTLSFIDSVAYRSPPIIGSYCDGWYKKGNPEQVAQRFVAENLINSVKDFPGGTPTTEILSAWNRLPEEWVSEAANDVGKDHFLFARIDKDSVARVFRDQFTHSDYEKFLEQKLSESPVMFWAVFPELMRDGDVFVVFTLWQQISGTWNIAHVDIVCQ